MVRPTNDWIEERKALHERGLKRCAHCERTFPLSDFGKHVGKWDGLQSDCRPCTNQRLTDSQTRVRNRMGERAYLDRKNLYVRRTRARMIARDGAGIFHRKYRMLSRYGLTAERYDGMAVAQHGACAICKEVPIPQRGRRFALYVDHVKGTKKVRALLCSHCNLGIGNFFHDPTRLRAALAYLRKHTP